MKCAQDLRLRLIHLECKSDDVLQAFGGLPAFLYVWSALVVIMPTGHWQNIADITDITDKTDIKDITLETYIADIKDMTNIKDMKDIKDIT